MSAQDVDSGAGPAIRIVREKGRSVDRRRAYSVLVDATVVGELPPP